jgi:hypothetical protein
MFPSVKSKILNIKNKKTEKKGESSGGSTLLFHFFVQVCVEYQIKTEKN